RDALGDDLRGLKIGVLRHHWDADIPASDDVRRAMDAALDVLRRLGATLEECRVRPLGEYFDAKIIIAESEIFSVHHTNLIARPNGLGGNGLPLGMQILGRPFGETTTLRIGHAYERATDWHTRRPPLVRGATAPEVTPPPVLSGGADQVDGETRDLCVKAARRAGIPLDDLM